MVKKVILVPLSVFNLEKSTAGIELKKKYYPRYCVVLELVPLSGEENLKPCPQNRILVPLKGSFQNFR